MPTSPNIPPAEAETDVDIESLTYADIYDGMGREFSRHRARYADRNIDDELRVVASKPFEAGTEPFVTTISRPRGDIGVPVHLFVPTVSENWYSHEVVARILRDSAIVIVDSDNLGAPYKSKLTLPLAGALQVARLTDWALDRTKERGIARLQSLGHRIGQQAVMALTAK